MATLTVLEPSFAVYYYNTGGYRQIERMWDIYNSDLDNEA